MTFTNAFSSHKNSTFGLNKPQGKDARETGAAGSLGRGEIPGAHRGQSLACHVTGTFVRLLDCLASVLTVDRAPSPSTLFQVLECDG